MTENIALATSGIEKHNANADASNAQIATLDEDIKGLHADLQENDQNLKETTAEEDAARADWEASDDDAEKTLDAIKRAIEMLKARSADVRDAPEHSRRLSMNSRNKHSMRVRMRWCACRSRLATGRHHDRSVRLKKCQNVSRISSIIKESRCKGL